MSNPTFQHRHYVLIADIIASMRGPELRQLTDDERMAIAAAFGHALVGTNPNFDFGRFVRAAMGTPDTRRDKRR